MMRKIKTAFLLSLLIASCNSHIKTSDANIDSLFWEFFVHSENQIANIHFPLRMIDNGTARTLTKSDWTTLKEYNGFTRIFCSENSFLNFKANPSPKTIDLDYITPEENLISQMTFSKRNNSWQLEELKLTKENFQNADNFIGFLNKFMADSIFRKERIKFPIEYSERDESSGYNIKTELASDYRTLERKFDLQIKTKVILLLKDNEYSNCKGDYQILHYQESGTSTNITYYFKKINSNWFLTKYENLSV
jgi:hypothetical protein